MARKPFTEDQIAYIRNSDLSNLQLSREMKTSPVTISKVKNFRGAYRNAVLDLGQPILDSHGVIVGVVPDGA